MIKNFKCVVTYDGTNYYGWQKQKEFLTVQGMIEYCLEKIFNQKINTTGASRTDAGVHALGQVFNFKVETPITDYGLKKMLNSLLPEDIRIKSVTLAEPGFSSRFNVRKKFYRYIIYNNFFLPPFLKNYVWHIEKNIEVEKIKKILQLFKGKKNYFSFSTSDADTKNYERQILNIKIKRENKYVFFDFFGQSFLYNMIRKIVGCFIEYVFDKMTEDDIEIMFKKNDRTILKTIAPPQGLYLVKIIYNKGN